MRVLKRIIALVYLGCAVVSLGTFAGLYWGSYTHRFLLLMREPVARIAVTACGAVVALGALIGAIRLMVGHREPTCVHPAGNPDIEVTLAALESCARMAAEAAPGVLIDRIEGRVTGADESRVRFKVDAVALEPRDLSAAAADIRSRIECACDTMLGCAGTTARVRFLPSKTTVQPVEVSGE